MPPLPEDALAPHPQDRENPMAILVFEEEEEEEDEAPLWARKCTHDSEAFGSEQVRDSATVAKPAALKKAPAPELVPKGHTWVR